MTKMVGNVEIDQCRDRSIGKKQLQIHSCGKQLWRGCPEIDYRIKPFSTESREGLDWF